MAAKLIYLYHEQEHHLPVFTLNSIFLGGIHTVYLELHLAYLDLYTVLKGARTSLSIYLYNHYIDILFIAQDAKEDKDYNYCYLHCQQHVYHIISDRCTSCTIRIDHHSTPTLNSILFTLNSILFTLTSILFTLASILFTLNSILFTLDYILFTLSSILFTFDYILFTLNSILFTLDYILFTFNSILFTLTPSCLPWTPSCWVGGSQF